MNLKGTKTEKNLHGSFCRRELRQETSTHYYASKAKKDGYVQIAKIFEADCS